MKRIFLIILAFALLAAPAHATTYAQVFQSLLTQQRATGAVLSGGKVYFYSPGTSNLATIYTDRNMGTPAANPATLSADGTVAVYGNGQYDVKITTSAGVQKFYWYGVSLVDSSNVAANHSVFTNWSSSSRDVTRDPRLTSVYDVANYSSMANAVTVIGSTPATLRYGTNISLSDNLTTPTTMTLEPYNGAVLTIASAKTLTVNGPSHDLSVAGAGNVAVNGKATGNLQLLNSGTATIGTGAVPFVTPEMRGGKADGVTNSGAAIIWAGQTGIQVVLAKGTYLCDNSPMDVTGWKMRGQGWSSSGADTNITALRFVNLGTNPAMKTRQATGMQRAILENFSILNGGNWTASGSQGYGFDIEQVVTMRSVAVFSFALSGMFFHHNVAGTGGPYGSLIENVYIAFNGNHGILVGTGANNLTFINPRMFWNGAPAPATAPTVANSYDGFHMQFDGDGNPGAAYASYITDSITVIGGDASYNAGYGWNFLSGRRSWFAPGYAEDNLHAAPVNANLGPNLQYCYFNFQHIQGEEAGINLGISFGAYLNTNQVWYGGKNLGSGETNTAPYTNRSTENMINVVSRDGLGKQVVIAGSAATGDLAITPSSTSTITIGNGTYKVTIANNKINIILPNYADNAAAAAGGLAVGDWYQVTGTGDPKIRY